MKSRHSFLLSLLFFAFSILSVFPQSLDQNFIKSSEYLEPVLVEDDFISSFGGWEERQNAEYSLEDGRLKAKIKNSYSGVINRLNGFKTIAGETLTVKIQFDKANTSSNIRLYLAEKDPNGNLVSWNVWKYLKTKTLGYIINSN